MSYQSHGDRKQPLHWTGLTQLALVANKNKTMEFLSRSPSDSTPVYYNNDNDRVARGKRSLEILLNYRTAKKTVVRIRI